MPFELTFPEQQIEQELANNCTQADIAVTYAPCLAHSDVEQLDWARINAVILTRYKKSGLERIKNRAWKIAQGRQA